MWFSPLRRALLGVVATGAAGWQTWDAMVDGVRIDVITALILLMTAVWLLYSAYRGWRHLRRG